MKGAGVPDQGPGESLMAGHEDDMNISKFLEKISNVEEHIVKLYHILLLSKYVKHGKTIL